MTRTHFFSSFEDGDPRPRAGAVVAVGAGPDRAPAAKARAGFTGLRAARYTASEPARHVLFEVDFPIGPDTALSYVVFPESDAGPSWRSTFVALAVELDDGTVIGGSAVSAGESKTLYLDQWNLVRHSLGKAAGRTARSIVLSVEPSPGEPVAGWLDDLRIADLPPHGPRDAVDWIRTTRGTHSSNEFSRGNTFPATAVPHGFNFWTPVTDASVTNWIYEYHRRNNADNRPELQALAVSHQPSPWMGDRHPFHFLPGIGPVRTGRKARALAFSHDNETDRPHHYGVRCDNGITVDLAPADHAALVRFAFPGEGGWVLFDNVNRRGGLRLDPARGVVTGHTWARSRLSVGARRMFVYGTFDRPATRGRRLKWPNTGYLSFDAPVVHLRIATSLISLAQARRNLDQEIPAGTTFEEVRDQARAQWQDLLGRVEIERATPDQLTTFYSSLYRLFLYPNSAHEHTPRGVRHASPVRRRFWPSTRTRTGAKVLDGPMSVNHGFWDTYRTVWPALALLAPRRCGELIEGFVQQFREGGWISRWSSPGYANLMTGTSSDVAFADAWLRGVRGFDVHAAYEAALRNATVTPPGRSVGRQGLRESIFLGFTPLTTPEGLSWALEGCVNDFGLAGLAQALGHHDNARYFRQRAAHYANHFDARTGFFQGRHRDGRWRWEPGQYDPALWGFDYTETNGWNTAFSVPHDGAGLARLLGGRAALESTLDTFFATPETGRAPGSYGGVIHEMTEARDVRLGQYGHSNQPSHHIPWMYCHAGAAAKTQAVVREVLTRCYLGSEIGQGYPGDEDNGEMSAWYVFAALGLYPLAVGNPGYVLTAPLFEKATLHLEGGRTVVISAPGAKPYVRGLTIDGRAHGSTWLSHEELFGAARLEFEGSDTPTDWGDPPPSPNAAPLTDVTASGTSDDGTDVAELFANTTATQVVFRSRTPVIECPVSARAEMYTLTSAARGGDPSDWVLEGLDGQTWVRLDERRGERFRWRRQTRPFTIAEPGTYRAYRLRITAATGRRTALTEWELLGNHA
ncbi:GH92 family glycosyl hydrolase [Amycolatopsis endophytica]|uniref:Putative alpha-1,2-mannosidase n=1 Tax=Amycolatopsis endophytica TaxID=860233 RepID=A0A853BB37_9PSEU|nr:GH92 family glycosyl hydrolase [Amycolatopsis endophytica]NYI91962.1 putative alpha-1,2-mannosidase [Amycolatopsis endophytica]